MPNVGKSSSAIYLCHWTLRSPRRTPLLLRRRCCDPIHGDQRLASTVSAEWVPFSGLCAEKINGETDTAQSSSKPLDLNGWDMLGLLEVGHAGMYVTGLWEVDRLDCLRWGKEPEDHPAVMALSGRSVATDGGDRKQKWQRFTKPCKTKGCMKPSCVNDMVGTIRGTVVHGICQYLQHSSMPRNWPLPKKSIPQTVPMFQKP